MINTKRLVSVSYWIIAVFVIAAILSSLEYSFPEALLYATLFFPGALAMKYFFPKVSFRKKAVGIRNTAFIIAGILCLEVVLILTVSYRLNQMKLSFAEGFDIPPIIINPLFILALIALMLAGDYFLNHYIDKYLFPNHEPVTFFSDRHKVSLNPSEILYIESNDTEVWIYATLERKFRNKTPISQWENLLGKDFVRIHRSYLVNKTAISTVKGESVFVGSHQLPMSKKYSQKVTKFKTWGGSK